MSAADLHDFNDDLSAALAAGVTCIHIPAGQYVVPPLRLPSGTHISADPAAHIRLADGAGRDATCHLLTNSDPADGNHDITIEGGVWDGNNPTNPRGPDLPGSYSGVPLSFINVRNLTAKGTGITQDDMVALVADDLMNLAPNAGLTCGPLERITVETLRADDCHSFVRLGSVFHAIRDVTVRDVVGGCRVSALNADALRYCAGPVFDPDDPQYATGVGLLENVHLEQFCVHKSAPTGLPLFMLESRLHNVSLRDIVRERTRDEDPECALVRLKHMVTDSLVVNGTSHALAQADTFVWQESQLDALTVADCVIEPVRSEWKSA